MSKKYQKITKPQVLQLLTKQALTINWYPILWSAAMVARHLKTSKYQAAKYLRELCAEKSIYYNYWAIPCTCYELCECEAVPPIWGYQITNPTT